MPRNSVDGVPASIRERAVSALTRPYPLNSGCGRLANSRVVAALAQRRSARVWAELPGFKMLCPMDDLVGRSIYFTGDLDPKTTWVLRKFVRDGDVVFDIGANLGLMSLRMATIVRGGVVHAFEPNPEILRLLRASIDSNPALNIRIHPIALGSASGSLPLSIPQGNEGQASLTWRYDGGRSVRVDVKRLSDYCAEAGIKRVDFMKIDVEGFEAEVLEGGAEFIARSQPRAILFEENGFLALDAAPRSFCILKKMGFRVFALPKNLVRNRLVPLDHRDARSAHDFVALRDGS